MPRVTYMLFVAFRETVSIISVQSGQIIELYRFLHWSCHAKHLHTFKGHTWKRLGMPQIMLFVTFRKTVSFISAR